MAQQATIPVPPLTINWVPEGFKWSPDAANKAAARGSFLRVGGQSVTRRFLSGAKRSWASANPAENQTVFHTVYRITGTPENIRIALHYAGVSDQEIDNILATTITSTNWNNTMAQDVENEIARRNALKQDKPTQPGYTLDQILWFYQNLKTAVIASKSGEQGTRVASPGRVGASESLAEKIRKLGQGKVLDVSNMDLATGKGVRTVSAPKTNRSGKFGATTAAGQYNVPIISNNLEKYARAIQLAYPGEEQRYAQDIEVVKQGLLLNGIQSAAPVAAFPNVPVRTASPPKVAGATIAAPPVFTAAVPRIASPKQVATMGGANLPGIPALGGLLRQ